MGVYGGIQLPKISENTLDDRKERKQILNYLALLDEKLRYMFQNIDIEENLSEDSKGYLFRQGEAIRNVVKDMDGNFSLFEQTINSISFQVQDLEGNYAILQQTAAGLSSAVASVGGDVSTLQQTASRIETAVYDLEGDISTVTQTANSLSSTVKSLGDDLDNMDDEISSIRQKANRIDMVVTSGSTSSSITLTSNMIKAITNQVDIEADVNLYGYMTVYTDDDLDTVGGKIGYSSGASTGGKTNGIRMGATSGGYVLATTGGVRMTDGSYAVVVTDDGVELKGQTTFTAYTNFNPSTSSAALGNSSNRWNTLYITSSSIVTSDEREKSNILYDMAEYERLFEKLKPTQYKMIDGTSDRFHVGFISQDVEKAMEDINMDSKGFAGFIKSPVYEVTLGSGEPDTTSEIIDHRYSLRYDEFVALNTHMIQKLMTRVTELENKLEALS